MLATTSILKRDRLEIEILGGGSTGIFGIMGVKKAKVKARPRVQVDATGILNGEEEKKGRSAKPKAPKADPAPEVEAAAAPEVEAVRPRLSNPHPRSRPRLNPATGSNRRCSSTSTAT